MRNLQPGSLGEKKRLPKYTDTNTNERGEITADISEIQAIIREYCKVIYQQTGQSRKHG